VPFAFARPERQAGENLVIDIECDAHGKLLLDLGNRSS
jgi:hypothetical protein